MRLFHLILRLLALHVAFAFVVSCTIEQAEVNNRSATATGEAAKAKKDSGTDSDSDSDSGFNILDVRAVNSVVSIAWDSMSTASSYTISLCAKQDCTEPIIKLGNISSDKQTITIESSGDYFVCVYYTDRNGKLHAAKNNGYPISVGSKNSVETNVAPSFLFLSSSNLSNFAGSGTSDAPYTFNIAEGSSNGEILFTATDDNKDAINIVCAAAPSYVAIDANTKKISFAPTYNDAGNASFSCQANDGSLSSDAIYFSVTVDNTNRAPILTVASHPNLGSWAGSGTSGSPYTFTIAEASTDGEIVFNAVDLDGDNVTLSCTSAPGWSTLDAANKKLSFAPGYNDAGAPLSFGCKLSDGNLDSATVYFSVTVTNTNRAPNAINDAIMTTANTPKSFNPLTNDSDDDGDSLSITAVGTAAHGSVTYSANFITYEPAAGYTGSDSFTYTVSDGTDTATATVNVSVAAPFTWLGGTDNKWSTNANWAGGSKPGAGQVAIFTEACLDTCDVEIDANISIGGISISAGYTGTITQTSNYTITVGSSRWVQAGGSFIGGSGDMTINGRFLLSGGSFTSTSGTTTISYTGKNASANLDAFTVSGGTFTHNSGSWVFNVFGQSSCGSSPYFKIDVNSTITFNNLTFNFTADCDRPGYVDIGVGDTLVVEGNFTHTDAYFTGAIDLYGNLSIGASAPGSLGTITMKGNANQTYAAAGGRTGFLILDKNGGQVQPAAGTTSAKFAGLLLNAGSFTAPTGELHLGHTFNTGDRIVFSTTADSSFAHNNGSVVFDSYAYTSCGGRPYFIIDVHNDVHFYDVTVNQTDDCSNVANLKVAEGDIVIVDRHLTFIDGALYGGMIQLHGNLNVQETADGGEGSVVFAGNANQTYSNALGGIAPILEVDKSGGSVTAAAGTTNLRAYAIKLKNGSFTAPSGELILGYKINETREIFTATATSTFNHNNGTMRFIPSSEACGSKLATIDVNGTIDLYDVVVATIDSTMCGNHPPTVAVETGDAVNVLNTFTVLRGFIQGTWNFYGDVSLSGAKSGGSAVMNFVGSADRTFTFTGQAIPTGHVTVNLDIGSSLILASDMPLTATGQKLTIQSGSLNLAGNTLTVNNALTIAPNGTLTLAGGSHTQGSLVNNGTIN